MNIFELMQRWIVVVVAFCIFAISYHYRETRSLEIQRNPLDEYLIWHHHDVVDTERFVPVAIGSYNVEDRGSDPDYLVEYLRTIRGIDIWGFCEFGEEQVEKFTVAVNSSDGGSFTCIVDDVNGQGYKLAFLYNQEKFTLVESSPLPDFEGTDGWGRNPFCAVFQHRETERQFCCVLNHLRRGLSDREEGERQRQAEAQGLNTWVQQQSMPTFLLGDYNFDYQIKSGTVSPAYDVLIADRALEWVKPQPLIDTIVHPRFRYYILDFFFANPAVREQGWSASSIVVEREGDYPDDDLTSDHRPVVCKILIPRKDLSENESEDANRDIIKQDEGDIVHPPESEVFQEEQLKAA